MTVHRSILLMGLLKRRDIRLHWCTPPLSNFSERAWASRLQNSTLVRSIREDERVKFAPLLEQRDRNLQPCLAQLFDGFNPRTRNPVVGGFHIRQACGTGQYSFGVVHVSLVRFDK